MAVPDGYRVDPPTWADLDGVAAVLAADDLEDAGSVVLDTAVLRRWWSHAGFDLACDAWVVRDVEGKIVGYGQIRKGDTGVIDSWGVIHPGHRGRGIGTLLSI